MAEEVTPEKEAEQPAEENSTQEQIPVPEEKTAEEVPETTTEAPANQTAEEKKAWDKDRQKRDKEAADERKKLEAERVQKLEESVHLLTKIVSGIKTEQPTQEIVKDDLAEWNSVQSEIKKLTAKKKEHTSKSEVYEASELSDQIDELRNKADDIRLNIAKADRQAIKRQESANQEKTAATKWWDDWETKHPDHSRQDAEKLVASYFKKFGDKGYKDAGLHARVNEEFDATLDTVKKSKPSSTVTSQTPPKTATKPGSTAPPGTKVTPSGSGVRAMPSKTSDAAAFLGNLLIKKK